VSEILSNLAPKDLEGLIDIAQTQPETTVARQEAETVAQVAETTDQPEAAQKIREEAASLPEDKVAELSNGDIRDSETLQKLGALPGDKVVNNKLVRLVSEPPRGEVLTKTDILNSPTLQELGAEAGDTVEDNRLIKAGKNDPLRNFVYHYKEAESTLENAATYLQSVAPLPDVTLDITDPLNFIDFEFDDPEYQEFLQLSPQERRDKMAADKEAELEAMRKTFNPENDLASLAGTVVGSTDVATAAVPLGSTIPRMAGIGGVLGGGYNVSNQLAETGDIQVEIIPGDVALGIAGGGVFGAGSRTVATAAKQIAKPAKTRTALKQTERVEKALNDKVSAGVTPSQAFREVQDELGLSKKDMVELASAAGRKIKVPSNIEQARMYIFNDDVARDSALMRQVSKGFDKYLSSLSTVVKNISSSAFGRLRKMEADLHVKTAQSLDNVLPFLRTMKNLPKEMKSKVGLHLSNQDYDLAAKMLRGTVPDIDNQLDAVKNELKTIANELKEQGHQFDEIDNYFPRMVKDYENYRKYLTGAESDDLSRTLDLFAKKKGKSSADDLTREERSEVIGRFMQGSIRTRNGKLLISERQFDKINSNQYSFYEMPEEALQKYIRYARNDIERRKFFGTHAKNDDIGMFDPDASIESILGDSSFFGRLDNKEITELAGLFQSRFIGGARNMGNTAAVIRDLGYAGTIANPISAIKQMTDLFNVGAIYGYRNVFKSMFGAKDLKLIDVGIENATNELQEASSMSGFLNTVFKRSGFQAIDRLGKETAINAGLSKLRAMAKTQRGREQLRKDFQPLFRGEFDSFLDDLQRGDVTANVKVAGFNLLADLQPIARSEMPQAWLNGGDAARMAYMLKSFTLKQLDVVRREVVQEYKKGNEMQAIKKAATIAASLSASGVAVSTIADILLKREVYPEEIPDRAVWSVLSTYGMNQYVAQRYFAQGDVIEGLKETLLPATNILEAVVDLPFEVFKDNPDYGEQLRAIPVVGPVAYAWFGGGAEKYNERTEARKRREEREKQEEALGRE